MRFMIIVKATKNSEAGVLPDEKLLAAMMKYNEELMKAGVMLGAKDFSRARRARVSDSLERSAPSSMGRSPRRKS